MLQYFRKHQKVIFLFTTVVIVISFLFFGTFSSVLSMQTSVKDEEIGKLIDGTSLKKRKLQVMTQFLSASIENIHDGGKKFVNLLNDGVVEKDVLATPLAKHLINQYSDQCQNELMQRCQRAAAYKPYVHPRAPHISVEEVYATFDPSLKDALMRMQKNFCTNSQDAFQILSEVYLKQKRIPSEMIKRIITFQESQATISDKDLSIENIDFSLFGYHNLTDWFGERFLQLTGQFILQAASYARTQGLEVTKAQARKSLVENLAKSIKLISNESISKDDLTNLFHQQLNVLGVDEALCLDIWCDILLFRQLFAHADSYASFDEGLISHQKEMAKKVSFIDMYELPSTLKPSDFSALMKLQVYIESISHLKNRSDLLEIPRQMLSTAEVEKKVPELVQKGYVVEYSEATKADVLSQIALKDIVQWQMNDANWTLIKQQIPCLAKEKPASSEEKYLLMESLSSKDKQKLDLMAQNAILDLRPDLIKQALQNAQKKTKELKISLKGSSLPFKIENHQLLMQFLDKAPTASEKNLSAEMIAAKQKLLSYTEDGVSYYSIHLISRDDAKRILTFSQASSSGVLDQLLTKRLEELYPDARRREPLLYQYADGSLKPLSEVKEHVGRFAFADLLKAIEGEYTQHFGIRPSPQQLQTASFYTSYRMLKYVKMAKQDLEINPDDPRWVLQVHDKMYQREIERQWLLKKVSKEVSLTDTSIFISNKVLDVKAGDFSSIVTTKAGVLSFFKMIKKELRDDLSIEEKNRIDDLVHSEAKNALMKDLILQMKNKSSVYFISRENASL
jgi:hypothetical protein